MTLLRRRSYRENELAFQDLIAAIGNKYQHKTNPSPDQCYQVSNGTRGDREAVFCELDAILKSTLDRTTRMRVNMSRAHAGHYECTMKASYTQHVDTIRNLSLGGKLGVALWLRYKMIHRGVIPDVVTHNYLINRFCEVGALDMAERLVREMSLWGPSPNCATYNTLMKGYCTFDVDKALCFLDTMIDGKVKPKLPNIVTFNILVHALCKKGRLEIARNLLLRLKDEDSQKNVIALTILMDNCFKIGNTSLALTLWEEICAKQVDVVAYNVIIRGFCLKWDLIVAYKYVNEMFKLGLLPDNFTYNTLITALCKVEWIDEALYLYNVMSRMGVAPDRISYNILIQGLCMVGDVDLAHASLNSMLESSMVPAPRTWNIIIDGYGKMTDMEYYHRNRRRAEHIYEMMIKYGVPRNVFTYKAFINMLVGVGAISEAYILVKEMIVEGALPDTVAYNLLIRACSEFGDLYSGYDAYNHMLKRGYEPDVVTYTILIKGYCLKGKIMVAERVFMHMLRKSNLEIDHVPFLLLIKKYFKQRDFDRAYVVYLQWLRMIL